MIPGILCIVREEFVLKIVWKLGGMLSLNWISENSQTTVLEMSTPYPQLTMSWINEVEMSKSMDDLMTSQSIQAQTDFLDLRCLMRGLRLR